MITFPVKLFPLALACSVFRVFSFALLTCCLRYYAIPLYILLLLGSVVLGRVRNPTNNSFVIRGIKSVLTIGKFNVKISTFDDKVSNLDLNFS